MRYIILMRHAKSSWDSPTLYDHERPLNERGQRDAVKMGHLILEQGIVPEYAISSDSFRTRQTAKGLIQHISNLQFEFRSSLYHATAEKILDEIIKLPARYKCVLVLAHNPGITDAFFKLAKVKIDNVPTAGTGCFGFNVDRYNEIESYTGSMEYFIYPKK